MIINGRMVIGTLPYENMKAILQAVLDRAGKPGAGRFIEGWEDTKPAARAKTAR
jgi:hypothetical protein